MSSVGCAKRINPGGVVLLDIEKPHMTIATHCKKSQVPPKCAEGLGKAIDESASVVRKLGKCRIELDACDQHGGVDKWFYENKLKDKQDKLESESWKKWYWSVIAAAIASAVTAIGFTAAQ